MRDPRMLRLLSQVSAAVAALVLVVCVLTHRGWRPELEQPVQTASIVVALLVLSMGIRPLRKTASSIGRFISSLVGFEGLAALGVLFAVLVAGAMGCLVVTDGWRREAESSIILPWFGVGALAIYFGYSCLVAIAVSLEFSKKFLRVVACVTVIVTASSLVFIGRSERASADGLDLAIQAEDLVAELLSLQTATDNRSAIVLNRTGELETVSTELPESPPPPPPDQGQDAGDAADESASSGAPAWSTSYRSLVKKLVDSQNTLATLGTASSPAELERELLDLHGVIADVFVEEEATADQKRAQAVVDLLRTEPLLRSDVTSTAEMHVTSLCGVDSLDGDLPRVGQSCDEDAIVPPGSVPSCVPWPPGTVDPVDLRPLLDDRERWQQRAVLAALAECEIARLQVALGLEESESLDKGIAAAEAALSRRTGEVLSADSWTDLSAGVGVVIDSATDRPDQPDTSVSAMSLLLVLVVLLWGYRRLEVFAGILRLGPVTVEFEDKEAGSKPEAVCVREALLRTIPEPGAVPGASTTSTMESLVGTLDVPHGAVVKGALAGISAFFATASGYKVVVSWIPPAAEGEKPDPEDTENVLAGAEGSSGGDREGDVEAEAPEARCFVRIKEARRGHQLATKTVAGPNVREAAARAGFWAAGWIQGRSLDVPSWARWDEGSAEAARLYQHRSLHDVPLDDVQRAVALAPDFGLLTVAAGYRYDLEEDFGRALELYLRARQRHKRMIVARFRSTASIAMVTSDMATLWGGIDLATRRRICDLIPIEYPNDEEPVEPDLVTYEQLTEKCKAWARQDRWFTWLPTIALGSLRRSERAAWLKLRSRPDRRRWQELLLSAELLTLARTLAPRSDEPNEWRPVRLKKRVRRKAKRADAGSSLAYNLACYYSIRSDEKEGFLWLERAIGGDGSDNLTQEWLRADPDLRTLRDENPGRFEETLARAMAEDRRVTET
ncbi:MAG: hypothetical protein GY788_09905 [bacterium]|nr:hypothetical protein [bacterium]